jgi:hypothetical protein
MGRCCSCAERLTLKVRCHERNYNEPATRTVSRSDRKGRGNMLKRIAGVVLIELMWTALAVGMLIAVAMS